MWSVKLSGFAGLGYSGFLYFESVAFKMLLFQPASLIWQILFLGPLRKQR
jgi:hypothetical protein